jgi:DNA-binding XRE family transcriptional regulator
MEPLRNEGAAEEFRGTVSLLRGRTGLAQRELAARLGVRRHSVQAGRPGSATPPRRG